MTRLTRNRTARPRRHALRPRLDALEERTLLSNFQVTNTGDSGPGSLRQADPRQQRRHGQPRR